MLAWIKKYPLLFTTLVLLIGFSAYWLSPGFSAKNGLQIIKDAPDFTLQDLNGHSVQASSNSGKVVLLEFMFTSCPDICPATTYNMVQMQNTLQEKEWFGNKIQFVAVTIDPTTDTPEVLRSYAEHLKMDMEGWHVLRGDEAETKQIAADYDVTVQKLADGQFVHSVTSLTLIDAQQRIRKVYKMGEEMDLPQILTDIELLVKEQAGG